MPSLRCNVIEESRNKLEFLQRNSYYSKPLPCETVSFYEAKKCSRYLSGNFAFVSLHVSETIF